MKKPSTQDLTPWVVVVAASLVGPVTIQAAQSPIDVARAAIVVRPGTLPAAERAAGEVLREELERRTGARPPLSTAWPDRGVVLAISSTRDVAGWTNVPEGERRPEGY